MSQRKRRELQEKGSRADGGERPLSSFQSLPRVGQNTGLGGGLRLVRRAAEFQLEGKKGWSVGQRSPAWHGGCRLPSGISSRGVSGGEDGGDGGPGAGRQLPCAGRDEILLRGGGFVHISVMGCSSSRRGQLVQRQWGGLPRKQVPSQESCGTDFLCSAQCKI